jgi:hypothetical protein
VWAEVRLPQTGEKRQGVLFFSLTIRGFNRYLGMSNGTSEFVSDTIAKARVTDALKTAFESGGCKSMMLKAYQIEAGMGPFSRVNNRRQWLIGVLSTLSTELTLSDSEVSIIAMYRQDLRTGK